jgi:uncharacterized membrane protein YfcA
MQAIIPIRLPLTDSSLGLQSNPLRIEGSRVRLSFALFSYFLRYNDSMLLKVTILVLIGLLTGTITAISAGSGVTIVVPLLTIFLGYSIHEAIGTSLLVDVIASIIVAYNYYRYGKIDLKAGTWLALGAVVGAQAGSHFASLIPQAGLKGGFSIFIILSGLSFFYRAFGKRKISLDILKVDNKTMRIVIIVVVGLFIGLSTGLFGTGGGATIMVVLIYLMDFPIHTAIGTATALMAITAASGVVGYTIQGHIPWLDGVIIGLAAMGSGVLFSKAANKASEKALNIAVASIFIAIGVAMFFVEGGTDGVMQSLHAFVQ